MSQTMTGFTFVTNKPIMHNTACTAMPSVAAQFRSARRGSFRVRSNTHMAIKSASEQTPESEPAQDDERFVSVSDLLAEVRASNTAKHSLLRFTTKQQCYVNDQRSARLMMLVSGQRPRGGLCVRRQRRGYRRLGTRTEAKCTKSFRQVCHTLLTIFQLQTTCMMCRSILFL